MTLLTVSAKCRNCTKLLIIFSFTVVWRCVTIYLSVAIFGSGFSTNIGVLMDYTIKYFHAQCLLKTTTYFA